MNSVDDINYGLKIIAKGKEKSRPEIDDINYGLKIVERARREEARRNKKGWMSLPRKVRRNISFSVMGIIFVILLISGIKSINNYQQAHLKEKLNSFNYVKVYVKKGDTAYELQSKLAPNKDVRELLYYASYMNDGVNFSNIQAGEFITLIKE